MYREQLRLWVHLMLQGKAKVEIDNNSINIKCGKFSWSFSHNNDEVDLATLKNVIYDTIAYDWLKEKKDDE